MFLVIYLYNKKYYPYILSARIAVLFLTIPSTIFWYIIFVYNNFLCVNPLKYNVLVNLLFCYIYVFIYVFFETKSINYDFLKK